VNKKKQKNFIRLAPGPQGRGGDAAKGESLFASFSSEKEDSCLP
jgi:hypothetical protein